MGPLLGLPPATLFRLWLVSCCGALLVGLVLVTLALPSVGLAQSAGPATTGTLGQAPQFPTRTPTPKPSPTATPKPSPTDTATPRPPATATPRPAATATAQPTATQPAPTATPVLTLSTSGSPTPGVKPSSTVRGRAAGSGSQSKVTPAPAWVMEGMVALFVVLLVFSLIIFPIAMHAARAERQGQPVYRPAPRRSVSSQVARLSQIPQERKEPLSRERMLALRESQHLPAIPGIPEQSTASLAAVRLVNRVPAPLPITEAETRPQLPPARRPGAGKIVDRTSGALPPQPLPPPAQNDQLDDPQQGGSS